MASTADSKGVLLRERGLRSLIWPRRFSACTPESSVILSSNLSRADLFFCWFTRLVLLFVLTALLILFFEAEYGRSHSLQGYNEGALM